jgi:ribosomal protein S18 acetylase RimI-like enzyme
MDRAMEICARSLFKHVMLRVMPDNGPARRLFERFGFRPIGQIVSYQRGGTGVGV